MSNALITFWGSRGSIATPGRSTERFGGNTSCVSVLYEDAYYIFDAGTGIRGLGMELMELVENLTEDTQTELNIFLSHTHWDHIQGFPFFQPAYDPRFKLNIYGSEEKDHMLEKTLSGQMNSVYFPVPMSKLNSKVSMHTKLTDDIQVHDITISCTSQHHPGGSTAFKLTLGDGRSIIYATDNELNQQFDEKHQPNTKMGEDYFEFIKGCDFLIADGQYTDEEYPEKKGWGHTSLTLLHDIAYQANVKTLAVYHHDPMHNDRILEDLVHKYTNFYNQLDRPMQVLWAREGLTIPLKP